ncbi:non-structural maintenance of chromosomes element 1-like protein [Vairimorpha necatrix]|uniref:Non-structural maintenance of chromosomes element 1-like protein n=1 Tax=Vairimorpha necatrix TaxID=6039 RepID=A0AAX4JAG1_9MICR
MKEEELQNIIYELLSTGMYKSNIKNLNEVVSILRKIHFDVVEWYDKSCYILVSTGGNQELILGYNEEENKEIIEIFEKIIFDKEVQGNLLSSLVENDWLSIDEKNKYILSKRALVIFKNKILEADGIYKKCKFCEFLVRREEAHDYCQKIFDEKNCF